MSLLIVVINFRTPQLTIDCLSSVAAQIDQVPGTRLALVDNGSPDDSPALLAQAIARNGWAWITLIRSPVNRGFAGGNNLALQSLQTLHPDASFVLLLNSDTILLPGALPYCVQKMQGDASVGLMSCLLLNADQTVQNTARKMPTPLRLAACSFGLPWLFPRAFAWANLDDPGWDRRTEVRNVDWVGGAFMLIRRQVLERIGLLDDRFFFYGEDAEFCHRVRKHGWWVRYDSGAAVVHRAAASSDAAMLPASRRTALVWQARYLLQRRCFGLPAELLIRFLDIAASTLRYFKLLIRGRKNTPQGAAQRDLLALLLRWPVAGKG
ncbi:MAG: glycosyltransferase family 2 protein [Tepidisphaeraceae bacterium]|jgi:hypothetical protein